MGKPRIWAKPLELPRATRGVALDRIPYALNLCFSHLPIPPLTSRPTNNALSIGAPATPFHSGSRRHNQLSKSPSHTFVDVLKDELHKNREFAENAKQLQGDVDKSQDLETMKGQGCIRTRWGASLSPNTLFQT